MSIDGVLIGTGKILSPTCGASVSAMPDGSVATRSLMPTSTAALTKLGTLQTMFSAGTAFSIARSVFRCACPVPAEYTST